MRNLEAIDRDLAEAREALLNVEGMPTEVYSRIVGYYRSVRNWNRGKREEYGERKLYCINDQELPAKLTVSKAASPSFSVVAEIVKPEINAAAVTEEYSYGEEKLLLFIRSACPACPSAKIAAGKLGIPVELVNTDTPSGMDTASMYNVMSTPTAILFDREGREIDRARDSRGITALSSLVAESPVEVREVSMDLRIK